MNQTPTINLKAMMKKNKTNKIITIFTWIIFSVSYFSLAIIFKKWAGLPLSNLIKYSPVEYILLFLILISVFCLTMLRRDFSLYILVISVLFPFWINVIEKSLTSENFIFLFILIGLIVQRKKISESFPSKRIFIPFFVFILSIGISQIACFFIQPKQIWLASSVSAIRFVWQIVIIFLVLISLEEEKKVKQVLVFCLIIATGTVILGFLQWLGFIGVKFFRPLIEFSYTRFFGDIESVMLKGGANPYAAYLLMVIPILIAFIFQARKKSNKVWLSLLLVLFAWVFLYTLSRGSYLAIFASLIIFFIFIKGWKRKLAIVLLTLLLISMFFIPGKMQNYLKTTLGGIVPPQVKEEEYQEKKIIQGKEVIEKKKTKIVTAAPVQKLPPLQGVVTIFSRRVYIDLSLYHRLLLWQIGGRIFKDYPLTGTGYYTFGEMIPKYEAGIDWNWPVDVGDFHYPNAHSDFIQMFSDLGLIGGLAFLGLMGTLVYLAFLNYLRHNGNNYLNIALFAVVVSCFISGLSQNNFADSRLYGTFWIITGIIIFIYQKEKLKIKNEKRQGKI